MVVRSVNNIAIVQSQIMLLPYETFIENSPYFITFSWVFLLFYRYLINVIASIATTFIFTHYISSESSVRNSIPKSQSSSLSL